MGLLLNKMKLSQTIPATIDQLRINMRNRKNRVSMAYLVALFSMVSFFIVLIIF
nr:MAG TPA: hypothetical protein [Caudoviricetes sp.]DAV05555.1 MAG TPA: hypothetical protein [Caudoviricetes sp.]